MMKALLFGLALLCGTASCNRHKGAISLSAQAPLIVYQTKGDYRDLVPVGLNEDRTAIVSYPHPSDLKSGKGLRYPIDLGKGYLLDNQGIGPNVAFLTISYKKYSELEAPMELAEMFRLIKDADPLVQMYKAGAVGDHADPAAEIKRWIRNDSLSLKAVRLK